MISVITPLKNIISDGREPFFRRMIDALYTQTYQDFEHIVVDGGSTDGTVALLQKYHQEGHINTLISEPDRNVNDAMNKGIRLAQGDVIHVMNSDNYFTDPQFFEASLQALRDHNADFTHADRSIKTGEGKFVGIKRGDERSAFFRMPFRYQTMLIKKDVYDEVGPFDDKYHIAADYKFMMSMLLAGKRGHYIPKVYICSLDGGITSDRDKVVREVTQVLYESYGQQYGLSERDCQDIYLRRMSPDLFFKINTNIPNERIKKSLRYCYELSCEANKEGGRGSKRIYINIVTNKTLLGQDTPVENFSRGLVSAEIPELGEPIRGKVRDNWIIGENGHQLRLMITTDRQSAFVRTVCTVPGKGQISNFTSAFWFEQTKDIIPNHVVAIPHPNILIAKQVKAVLPVEIVLRRYMARGSTPTSIYQNYINSGRREIYGIKFPEGLKPDQEFPMGTIITPTTKAKNGHDEELTDLQAQDTIDSVLGDGIWDKVKSAAFGVFERARVISLNKGLILADTKMEFGLDVDDNLILVDEVLTPECSRFWRSDKYMERFNRGDNQDIDKDLLIRWLVNSGFNGEGPIPRIPGEIIDQMTEMYTIPYKMITGKDLDLQSGVESVGQTALLYLKGHKLL